MWPLVNFEPLCLPRICSYHLANGFPHTLSSIYNYGFKHSDATQKTPPKSQSEHKASFIQKAVEIFSSDKKMGFRLPGIRRASSFSRSVASSKGVDVPKGYLAVYVGEKMKRFVIPISYLNQSTFQDLLSQAEQEFGYDHPMGGLIIPCTEDAFEYLTSYLNGC